MRCHVFPCHVGAPHGLSTQFSSDHIIVLSRYGVSCDVRPGLATPVQARADCFTPLLMRVIRVVFVCHFMSCCVVSETKRRRLQAATHFVICHVICYELLFGKQSILNVDASSNIFELKCRNTNSILRSLNNFIWMYDVAVRRTLSCCKERRHTTGSLIVAYSCSFDTCLAPTFSASYRQPFRLCRFWRRALDTLSSSAALLATRVEAVFQVVWCSSAQHAQTWIPDTSTCAHIQSQRRIATTDTALQHPVVSRLCSVTMTQHNTAPPPSRDATHTHEIGTVVDAHARTAEMYSERGNADITELMSIDK